MSRRLPSKARTTMEHDLRCDVLKGSLSNVLLGMIFSDESLSIRTLAMGISLSAKVS